MEKKCQEQKKGKKKVWLYLKEVNEEEKNKHRHTINSLQVRLICAKRQKRSKKKPRNEWTRTNKIMVYMQVGL